MPTLVTLEGLPHSGRTMILRHLTQARPEWAAINVAPDPGAACSWASSASRANHALFASILRKTKALCKAREGVVLLNSPWFEHLPRHKTVWSLRSAVTRELVARVGCRVNKHVMIVLHVAHDETFEQLVCCGNPYWNGTSLADVAATQACIAQQVSTATAGTGDHPFACEAHTIHCPPFFEENEVVAGAITARIVSVVENAVS